MTKVQKEKTRVLYLDLTRILQDEVVALIYSRVKQTLRKIEARAPNDLFFVQSPDAGLKTRAPSKGAPSA